MTPEERRKQRLKQVSGWLKKDGQSSLRAMVGKMVLTWGSKRETVREYLEDLAWAGLIEVNEKEDSITWLGSG